MSIWRPFQFQDLRNVHAYILAHASQAGTVENLSRGAILAGERATLSTTCTLAAVPSPVCRHVPHEEPTPGQRGRFLDAVVWAQHPEGVPCHETIAGCCHVIFFLSPNTAQERVSCRFGKSRVVREGLRDSGECDKAALPTHLCHECTKIMSPIREPDLRSVASLFDRGRWISWGHAARKFKGSYSCTLLMVYWGCLEVPCLNLYSASLCSFCFRVASCAQ